MEKETRTEELNLRGEKSSRFFLYVVNCWAMYRQKTVLNFLTIRIEQLLLYSLYTLFQKLKIYLLKNNKFH